MNNNDNGNDNGNGNGNGNGNDRFKTAVLKKTMLNLKYVP